MRLQPDSDHRVVAVFRRPFFERPEGLGDTAAIGDKRDLRARDLPAPGPFRDLIGGRHQDLSGLSHLRIVRLSR